MLFYLADLGFRFKGFIIMGRTTNFASTCVLLTAILTGCSDTSTDNNSKVDELLIRAESYAQQNQYRAAIIEARNILQQQADNQAARLLVADINIELGNPRNAIAALEPVAKNSSSEVVLTLAKAYLLMGKANSAEKTLSSLNASTLTATQQTQALIAKATLTAQKGKLDQASQYAEQALSTANLSTALEQEARLLQVKITMANNKASSAEALLDQLIDDHSGFADALSLKARFAYQQDKLDQAEDLLSKALISLDQTDIITNQRIKILRSLSHILAKQGRPAEALVYSKLIADARPDSSDLKSKVERAITAYNAGDTAASEKQLLALYDEQKNDYLGVLLGSLKLKQGDYDAAYSYLVAHVDPETASPKALRMLTEAQLRLNKPGEATASLEENVRKNPNDAQQQAIYGLASLAQGKEEQGIAALNKALEIDPGKARLRVALAKHYNHKQQPEKAIQQLELAVNAEPNDPSIQGILINQLLLNGKTEQALTAARSLAKNNGDLTSQLMYGAALQQAQKPEEAKRIFSSALKTAPQEPRALKGMVVSLVAENKLTEADQYADQLIAVSPNESYAYRIKYAAAQNASGRRALSKALEQKLNGDSELWAPAQYIALDYIVSNQLSEAQNIATLLGERSHQTDDAKNSAINTWLELSRAYKKQGNAAETRGALMGALSLSPENPQITAMVIEHEIENNNLREAEKLIDSLKTTRTTPPALLSVLNADLDSAKQNYKSALTAYLSLWSEAKNDTLAESIYINYKLSQQQTQAVEFLAQWQDTLPSSTRAATLQGDHYMANNQHAEAIKTYRKAISLQATNVIALNNLAWLEQQNGNAATAIKHAKAAYALAPQSAAIADTYGWILSQNNRVKEALPILEKAAALAPDNAEIAEHLRATKAKN
jgi:tetratricopeptide (TPR) repeat protein